MSTTSPVVEEQPPATALEVATAPQLSLSDVYHPAFSSPNADVVLLSVDSVRFRVPSELLSRSSAWFRTMLSLPQGPGMDRTEAIPVDEPSDVLADVLSIVNGSDLPALDQVDRLETLL